jgi:phage-related holin
MSSFYKGGDFMSQELQETFSDVWAYIYKSIIYVKPLWILFTSVLSYILFPHKSYIPAAIALVCALILDVATKYYSVGVKNGGLLNALRTRKLTSESLWRGSKKKVISVLIVMILCGLSFRISTFSSIAILLSTVCYSLMFLRESQSILENVIDAGHEDLKWLLFLVKKKQKDILDVKDENIDQ